MTISLPVGRLTSTFLRLCVRAPRTTIGEAFVKVLNLFMLAPTLNSLHLRHTRHLRRVGPLRTRNLGHTRENRTTLSDEAGRWNSRNPTHGLIQTRRLPGQKRTAHD